MYKILLVDDNEKDLKKLKEMLIHYFKQQQFQYEMDSYCVVDHSLLDKNYDIVFLDIDMPHMNGFNLAKHFENSFLIFVTNRDDLVFDSFEYHPFAFIRKFLLEEEIEPILNRLIPQLLKKNQYITVQSFGQDIQLRLSNIIYIESYLHKCIIHTIDKEISLRIKLSDLQDLIHNDMFYSIHQSYYVNWNFVKSVKKHECILNNKEIIPISQRKYKDSLEAYHRFLLGRV